ncbi:MAG TPA: response regulator transcription factor [Solirubrobacteraceae bacterium]|nr:response regulator transcription factor [Solirubrobacteraceae bacterium]
MLAGERRSAREHQRSADPAGAESISILLADDHHLVRTGLRLLLEAQDGLSVVAEAGDIAGARRLAAAHRPDVLVLDVNLPDGSAVDAIPALREAAPATRIVVLTMDRDPDLARAALGAGAVGFVLKEAASGELIQAVRLAAAGGTYLNPELGAVIAAGAGRAARRPHDLTRRELEVLRLLALGHTNAEIAAQLYLSVRTVESHRAHLQRKTQLSSRAQLVAYAREHGLL